MKILITYYSRTGITKQLAEIIRAELETDHKHDVKVEEIIDLRSRKGPLGYIIGGKDASQRKETQIKDLKNDISKYDVVIIGTPVWAWTMTPAVRTFINKNKDKFKKIALFATQGGSGAKKAFKEIEDIIELRSISKIAVTSKDIKKDKTKSKVKDFVKTLYKEK